MDELNRLFCETLAKLCRPFPGEMDIPVQLVGIAAIEIIRVDPGIAFGLSQFDLRCPDLFPVFVIRPTSCIVIDSTNNKVEILPSQIIFEPLDEFVKTLFVNFGKAIVGIGLTLHPDEADSVEGLIFGGGQ